MINLKRKVRIFIQGECLASSNFVLPQFLSLRINNMTTFPHDLRISFEKGVNIIFGGNHSGKTTIVNSIKYGVFGLSWNQPAEGVEKRYFSNRIKEIERKSLEISAVYHIEAMTTTVRRTVFSSGTAEIEARTSKDSSKSLSTSAECISREKDYYDALREHMGLSDNEQLKFIPSLIFADENRQPVLWSKNLEDFVLRLLTSAESIDRLRLVESQLGKAQKDMDKLSQDKDQLMKKNAENRRISEFLNETLKKIERTGIDKDIKEYRTMNKDLEDHRIKNTRLNEALQNKLIERSSLQTQLNNNQRNLLDLRAKSEEFDKELVKAFLDPDDPKKTHFGRYFYYEKKCPFCSADLSKEINFRVENKKCPICGQGELTDYRIDMKKIEQKLSELDEEREKLNTLNHDIQKDLDKASEKIEMLTRSKEEARVKETALLQRLNESKAIEEDLYRKELTSKELAEMRKKIDFDERAMAKIDKDMKTVEMEIEKIIQLQNKTKATMKTEINLVLARIREKFSSFINAATNGELSAGLSQNFIPMLGGRPVFDPEQASQFERTLMDYAFRIVLLSVLAERTDTTPSLVLETPDEVTDEAYISYLAGAILSFSSNLSIIVTTVNSELMKQLLKNYKPNDKKKRLFDLVSNGTITQRKFYELPLSKYLSGRQ
jgi:DNA repair exonuclease SbcCD ATPase subunit